MKKYYNNQWLFYGFVIGVMACVFYDVQVWRALKDTLAMLSSLW